MLKQVRNSFKDILDDDERILRLLLILIGTSFLAFSIFSINAPLRGGVPHRWLNIGMCISAYLLAFSLFFLPPGIKTRKLLSAIFIYELNLVNVYLLYGTEHMDMYAYQFIVTYVISTYFFNTIKAVAQFVIVINAAVICAAFTSHAKSTSPTDFYMTYIACQIVFLVLYRYRYKIEQDLSESEKKYRLLAENSFDLICIHDAKGRVEFVSPSIKKLLGYEPEDVTGMYPAVVVHPDDLEIMKSLDLADPMHPFLQKPVQFRLRNHLGEYHWFETIFTIIDNGEGTEGAVLSQSRDIRRSKNYQQQLEERTQELERSNADLETFAFVSSHDMQEPLRMISNYTQLIKKRYHGKLDKDADEYIDYASNGAANLQQLIRDLLSYSRITRTEIKKTRVSMNDLLRELLKNIEMEVKEKNASIVYEDLHSTHGDRNLLMLIMQNLILNGIKYNRSMLPEIKISSQIQDKKVIYRVVDNGIGIEAKHRQRIFEPFQRLNTKAEFPGTGLGLAICKKIIERLGGEIWVEGIGSIFYFSLPAE
jgi:PAS domain S-box-containing protein